jgi:hypothetical protein
MIAFMVAGTESGVDKTTVAMALMAALRERSGYRMQPYKCKPDFLYTGHPSTAKRGDLIRCGEMKLRSQYTEFAPTGTPQCDGPENLLDSRSADRNPRRERIECKWSGILSIRRNRSKYRFKLSKL